MPDQSILHGTTILAIRRKNEIVMAGDGQVSLGQTIIKANARKVRQRIEQRRRQCGTEADA